MTIFIALTMSIGVLSVNAATQTQINDAIAAGLAWLAPQQGGAGNIGTYYPVASTGLAVLAFENNGHLPSGDPIADPYVAFVELGLDYIFSQAHAIPIGVQPAGDPDTNANGFGVYFGSNPLYETGIVMMTIVASQAPDRVAATGPANVIGRTYYDILVDVVDYVAWAQADVLPWRGGWRYVPNDGADNSVTQWPAIGLHAAELWGINAPEWVKWELLIWLTYTQNLIGNPSTNPDYGGFCYGGGYAVPTWWVNVAKTGAGIASLDYVGESITDAIQGPGSFSDKVWAAKSYLDRHWTSPTYDSRGYVMHFGSPPSPWPNLYAMYAVMKGCRLAIPPITHIGTHEWYNGVGEYADSLVANQQPDGRWHGSNWGDDVYNTAWAILILEYIPIVVRYDLTVNVVDDSTGLPIGGATVTATGPESASGTTDGGMVQFLDLQAGDYTVTASRAGYNPASVPVSLTSDTEITIRLTPTGPSIPEFSVGLSVITSLGAALYLLAKRKLQRK